MVILLGSKNKSKRISLELALDTLQIKDYEILSFDVPSGVNSKPIGYEIIRGADNRNLELKKIALEKNIKYDYLCSIEGGYEVDGNGIPYIVTYAIIEDKNERKSTGKSLGLRLTKTMFNYLRDGKSLNKVIEELIGTSNNKQNGGITGYLSKGLLRREYVDRDAVVSSLVGILYTEERKTLDNAIKLKLEKELG